MGIASLIGADISSMAARITEIVTKQMHENLDLRAVDEIRDLLVKIEKNTRPKK